MRTREALSETKRVRLSWTQLSAAFNDELRPRSMELGIPTVTRIFEPASDCRTTGSASNSLTLVTPLAFSNSTTFCGGRGYDAAVPQLTPTASASGSADRDSSNNNERKWRKRVHLRLRENAISGNKAQSALSPPLLRACKFDLILSINLFFFIYLFNCLVFLFFFTNSWSRRDVTSCFSINQLNLW